MSGTIVCYATFVSLDHDGITAGNHTVGLGGYSLCTVHVGWLLGTCIFTGWALPTQYLSLCVCGLLYVVGKNVPKNGL